MFCDICLLCLSLYSSHSQARVHQTFVFAHACVAAHERQPAVGWIRDECEVSVFINGGRELQYVMKLDAAEEAVFMSSALRHLEAEN